MNAIRDVHYAFCAFVRRAGAVAHRRGAFGLAMAGLVAGCSHPGPFAQRSALVGSLRESVSQLEADKQRLERQVAELGSDNRQFEDRLVQEEAYSKELAARLDNGRKVVERSSSDSSRAREFSDVPRTIPSRQPQQRRVPMAQIPGEIHSARESDEFFEDEEGEGARSRSTPREDEPADIDLFSSAAGSSQGGRRSVAGSTWLPLARGQGGQSNLR